MRRSFTLVAAGFVLCAPAVAQDDKVGVTAAVNPQAHGTPPRQETRELRIGLDMIRNERIVTGPIGKTQLLFIDGSALTVGPNADLTPDEFVYDPDAGAGRMAMTATKGVLRIVGGKLSKTEPIVLKTPTATLGIRGGIATAQIGTGSDFFGFLFGKQMTVDGTGADGQPTQQVVTRPGTGVPLGPGGVVLPPIPIPQDTINLQLGNMESNPGQSGGATERPTDTRVASTELAALGSNLPPEVVGAEPAAGGGTIVGGTTPLAPDTTNFSQLGLQNAAASGSASPTPSFPLGLLGGRYKSTPGTGSAAGTAGDGGALFNRAFDGAGFMGNQFFALAGGDLFSAPVNPSGGFLSYSDSEASSPFGPIQGTSFVSPNRDFAFFESIETDFVGERSFLFAGVPTPLSAIPASGFAAYDIRRDFVGNTNIPFIPADAGGNLTGMVSPAFIGFNALGGERPFMQYSLAINGSGLAQSSAISILVGTMGTSGAMVLNGEMRGSSRLAGNPASLFFGPAGFATDALGNGVFGTGGPDFFVLESNGGGIRGVTQSAQTLGGSTYFPNNVAMRLPAMPDLGASRSEGLFFGYIAGISNTTFANGTSVLHTAIGPQSAGEFLLLSSPQVNSIFAIASLGIGAENYSLAWGDASVFGRSAFIDDIRFAARESDLPSTTDQDGPSVAMLDTKLYMVRATGADISGILPSGVTPCECSFMRWGFWGGEFVNAFDGRRERVHLGTWVAGDLASVAQINGYPTGTAIYTGHAVANIVNAGKVYMAGGGFNMSYSFGPNSGIATITNLDGNTYTGGISGSMISNQPMGTLSNGAGIGGNIALGFYRGPGNDAAGVGGSFNFANGGQTYRAVGQQTSFNPSD
jgi:hypothetical protein